MNRAEIIWWLPIVFWIAFTTYLWVLASRVAKRDQVRLDNLELIWTAAEIIAEKYEGEKAAGPRTESLAPSGVSLKWGRDTDAGGASPARPVALPLELDDCANEPELQYDELLMKRLEKSVQMTAKRSGDLAS